MTELQDTTTSFADWISQGLHATTSRYDPSIIPHATIYVIDAALREMGGKNTIHWRPESGEGESLILTRVEDLKSKLFVRDFGRSTRARDISQIFERHVLFVDTRVTLDPPRPLPSSRRGFIASFPRRPECQ